MTLRALLLAACLAPAPCVAATLTVGPGQTYSTIAAAVAASHDRDRILVQSGTYTNDFVTVSTSISISSVGGRSQVVATVPVPNTKGIFTIGTATTSPTVSIDGFDFSGATTPANNAAGVMYQTGNLTLFNDSFHDNQDGVRGGPASPAWILVDHCEFFNNGIDSLTHNIYIGVVDNFTIQNSYIHDAHFGHNIKSRALNTLVRNNRIFDNGLGVSASVSYSVDIPQSGNAIIDSNILQQGLGYANPIMVAYGEEAVTQNPGTTFKITNNTFVNDVSPITMLVWNQSTATTANIDDNSFYGVTSGQVVGGAGPSEQTGTVILSIRPTLDTTTKPYMTAYPTPMTLSVVSRKLVVVGGALGIVPPGTGGGGIVAGAWQDDSGAQITDDDGTPITD